MSQETSEWLNTNTLIGFTEKRGNAWHYRAEMQGDESNHYTGAIPVADVKRRLFNWEPLLLPMEITIPEQISENGVTAEQRFVDESRLVTVRVMPDGKPIIMGAFKNGYVNHGYSEWGLDVMSNLVGDSLFVESAGLLKNGAVAWVQVSVAENVKNQYGYDFRPHLTFFTSLDGTLPSTYKRMATAVVCDNTLSAGIGESSQQIRIRHTKNSKLRIPEARDALDLLTHFADEMDARIAELVAMPVTKKQFSAFVNEWSPITDEMSKSAITRSEKRREELTSLYNGDKRVEPWRGTAFAIMQALNTYDQHTSQIQNRNGSAIGVARAERAMLNGLTGKLEADTADYLGMVKRILQPA